MFCRLLKTVLSLETPCVPFLLGFPGCLMLSSFAASSPILILKPEMPIALCLAKKGNIVFLIFLFLCLGFFVCLFSGFFLSSEWGAGCYRMIFARGALSCCSGIRGRSKQPFSMVQQFLSSQRILTGLSSAEQLYLPSLIILCRPAMSCNQQGHRVNWW